MNRQDIKEKYDRFKQWQEQPFDYKLNSGEVHHCINCGHDFTGNFCPICSQKEELGRVSWRSVRQGLMDIWGLGNRSLLYSLWQLLWRPGHVISDYIDGKRQVSFPPVKMLFIVAVLYSMIFYWFFPTVLGFDINDISKVYNEQTVNMMGESDDWMRKYYSWTILCISMLLVVPTWFMFRYSPRHTAHSLPEGFFIQVFIANLMVVLGFLFFPLGVVDPMLYTFACIIAYGIYYVIVYMHLFGYGLWGTLWRSGFIFVTLVFLIGMLMVPFVDIEAIAPSGGTQLTVDQVRMQKMFDVGLSLMLALMVLGTGCVVNYIATRKFRKELKQRKM